jgi:hypothetical protein
MDIRKLETFNAGHAKPSYMSLSIEEEVICTDGNASRLQQRFASTTSDTSAQVQALENRVNELSASKATREEVQTLRASSSKLTKKINNLELALGGKGGSGSGSGLVQMHADFREQYKDKVNYLDGESMEHGYHIENLLKRMAILEEQSQQYEEVLRTHGLPSPKRARSNNSGMDSRRRRNDLENLV